MLSQFVILQSVNQLIPSQSTILPISWFFNLSLFYSFVSFMWFVIAEILRMETIKPSGRIIPLICRKIVISGENETIDTILELNISLIKKIACIMMFLLMFVSFLAIGLAIT